jgi:hypothetical protein
MTLREDLKNVRDILSDPYWVTGCGEDALGNYCDFCKEIVPPGSSDIFPDGVVGIRVDTDFWAVAALPYRFRDLPTPVIVAELWPEALKEARLQFWPDSGSSGVTQMDCLGQS